ncbi:hypothetical protein ADL26_20645, partial [Thermoactinomyces vulgaris]
MEVDGGFVVEGDVVRAFFGDGDAEVAQDREGFGEADGLVEGVDLEVDVGVVAAAAEQLEFHVAGFAEHFEGRDVLGGVHGGVLG